MTEFIHNVLLWLSDLGYFGVMIGLMIEVIPSEIVLSYAGYLIATGEITFVGAVIAGTIGGLFSQLFLYWAGYFGGRPFLERFGKYILIKKHHIDMSEKWFNKYGKGVIFAARFIPVVRHAISIPAGIAKMSWLTFSLYTTLAIIPWSIFFIYLGKQLGENWEQIKEIASPYMTPVIIVAVSAILLYVVIRYVRNRKPKRI